MKKLTVIFLIVALMFMGGCCTRVVDGVTSKNFGNCLTAAQNLLCNPTDQQKAEAAAVLTFLTSGVQIAGLVVNVPITAAQVVTIFGMVQAGGCVVVTDFQTALAWYNALTQAMQKKAMAGKAMVMMPPLIPALQAWVK